MNKVNKPVLLLLPGLVCDAEVWQDQCKHLQDLFTIIVPNLNEANTPDAMVEAALVSTPENFVLAGHSMGGWVALEIMRRYPERVSALCLANTSARLDNADKAESREKLISLAEMGKNEELITILTKAFLFDTSHSKPVRQMIERNLPALINQETAMQLRQDCVPLLSSIHCPTLVMHAEHDAIFDISHSQQMADDIPNAALVIVQNSGHLAPVEQKEVVSALMKKWLIQYCISHS